MHTWHHKVERTCSCIMNSPSKILLKIKYKYYCYTLPPAWPIRRPGGAVSPAINATTGFSVPLSCVNNTITLWCKTSTAILELHDSYMHSCECIRLININKWGVWQGGVWQLRGQVNNKDRLHKGRYQTINKTSVMK